VKEQRVARTYAQTGNQHQYPQLALPLFVWRCGKRRWCVFDDLRPMVKAGGQRTATDNGGNDNDTDTHD
jgi:hypothetical protein